MRSMKFGICALAGAFLLTGISGLQAEGNPATKYQEGIHYTLIENAPVTRGGKVSVVEAFSYLCPHCGTFEPYIASWQQRIPANVDLRRIPVVFGRDTWQLYAQAYVTAEIMGVADKAHAALMDKVWKEKKVLKTMEELASFYSGYGVNAGQFMATSGSFAVDANMRRDQQYIQTAGVRGTPSLIVGEKYLVAGNEAVPNYDVMLDVVDFLIAKDLAEQPAAVAAGETAEAGKAEQTPAEYAPEE